MIGKKYDTLLRWMLIGIAAFNIADFMLTMIALDRGYQEINPFVNAILDTWLFPFLKVIAVPLIALGIYLVRRRLPKRVLGYVGVTFVTYFMLMVYFKVLLFPGLSG